MITVHKEFKWEAAHRLIQDYPGKCKNLHGHSYVAKVVMTPNPSSVHKNEGLDKFGFVKDFGDFKPLKDWIDTNLDHATLVSVDDRALIAHLEDLQSKAFIFHHPNTSAEYLAMFLFHKAAELLNDAHTHVCSVSINETCTSDATYQL